MNPEPGAWSVQQIDGADVVLGISDHVPRVFIRHEGGRSKIVVNMAFPDDEIIRAFKFYERWEKGQRTAP